MNNYTCVIKPAVTEFVKNINQIIYVDGTFCKNGGHLFCFSFLDANHHIQPLGCYYSRTENSDCMMEVFNELWDAGLDKLKRIMFMSDDGTAINKFIEDVKSKHEGVVSNKVVIQHVKCVTHFLRHIKEILTKEDKVEHFETIRQLFYYARYSPTVVISKVFLNDIKKMSESVYKYIYDRKEYYLQSEFEAPHFCCDTNNASESLMCLLRSKKYAGKTTRNSTTFGVLYRFVLVALDQMRIHKKELKLVDGDDNNLSKNKDEYCKYVMNQVVHIGYTYEVLKSRYNVEKYNQSTNTGLVEDYEWNLKYYVDLENRQCSCGKFQNMLFPCIHAIAILHSANRYYDVLSYVDDEYKTEVISSKIFPIKEVFMNILDKAVSMDKLEPHSMNEEVLSLQVVPFGRTKLKRRYPSRGEISERYDAKSKVRKVIKDKGTMTVGIRQSLPRQGKKK